jgi:Holliday junction resolvase RusA-like endonuclease
MPIGNMKRVSFEVNGDPVPKARARTVRKGGRTWSFTPKKVAQWEKKLREEALKHFPEPIQGPVSLTLGFYMIRPKSRRLDNYCATTPDLDNLEKAVLDGLNGVAYEDDRCVVVKSAAKLYTRGDDPHISVVVTSLSNQVRMEDFLEK